MPAAWPEARFEIVWDAGHASTEPGIVDALAVQLSISVSGTGGVNLVSAPVGADELLGLVSSLMPLGAAGIVASVVPVNDVAVVPVMVALHEALQRGATLPEALLAARRAAGGDPLAEATAHSFLALGA